MSPISRWVPTGSRARRTVPGVVVVRLDVPLFWANAIAIEDRLLHEVDTRPDTRALVLDLEATSQMEATSADVLTHLHSELEARGVELYLARVINPVSTVLEHSGFLEVLGEEHIWHSISQSVRAARRSTGLTNGGADHEDSVSDESETEVLDDEEQDPAVERLYAGSSDLGDRRDRAIAFHLGAYRDGHPRAAADTYLDERFEDHLPGTIGGRDELVELATRFVEQHPSRYVRVVRALEDGPHVFLHVFESLDHGDAERVVGVFFENDDDRIVGRWRVVAPYTHVAQTSRTSIDGPDEVDEADMTDENKAIVTALFEDVLIGDAGRDRAASVLSDPLVEHCAAYQDGAGWFRLVTKKKHPPLEYREIVLVVGEGNFVAVLSEACQGGVESAALDIFRLEHGRIVEHWHEVEPLHDGV